MSYMNCKFVCGGGGGVVDELWGSGSGIGDGESEKTGGRGVSESAIVREACSRQLSARSGAEDVLD